jgi:methionine-rich copper-binding protein CopC
MTALRALVVGGLLAALAILGPVPPGWSHAALVKSAPADGASLTTSPPVIRAWFSEGLAAKGSIMRLYDGHQKLLASGGVDPTATKHDVMKIATPTLARGAYAVQWYAISADDNEARKGSFKFSIGTSAQTTKPTMTHLPPLQLVAPTDHAQVKNPVALVIETPGDIDHYTMGGSMGGMSGMDAGVHLHIVVAGQVFMPTAAQLTKVGPSRYRFVLGSLSAGTHTIKVYWADNKTHEAMGPIHTATCTITG